MTIIIDRSTGVAIPTYDIMVDYDDVVMPWAQVVHDKCAALGLHDGSKPWSSWHMWEDYGCSKEEWENAVIAATADGLYTNTDPFPGAIEGLRRLFWSGHRIHIVTARGFMENAENIRRWTVDHVLQYGVPHHTLTFSKNKVDSMHELGVTFDFAIDDGAHNVDILAEAGVNVFMHNQPHNARHPHPMRVNSLWEFADMVLAAAAAIKEDA